MRCDVSYLTKGQYESGMLESGNHLTGRGITRFERRLLPSPVAIPSGQYDCP
jgi:hypothetical protein